MHHEILVHSAGNDFSDVAGATFKLSGFGCDGTPSLVSSGVVLPIQLQKAHSDHPARPRRHEAQQQHTFCSSKNHTVGHHWIDTATYHSASCSLRHRSPYWPMGTAPFQTLPPDTTENLGLLSACTVSASYGEDVAGYKLTATVADVYESVLQHTDALLAHGTPAVPLAT